MNQLKDSILNVYKLFDELNNKQEYYLKEKNLKN